MQKSLGFHGGFGKAPSCLGPCVTHSRAPICLAQRPRQRQLSVCFFLFLFFFSLFFTLFLFFPGRELILTEQTKQEATAN